MSVRAIPEAPLYYWSCKCKKYVIHYSQFKNINEIVKVQNCGCN